MSIDGAAAMKAMSDAHSNLMQTSMHQGPKVDESLSSELGEWNEEMPTSTAAEILATPRDQPLSARQQHQRANSELMSDAETVQNSQPAPIRRDESTANEGDGLQADFTGWLCSHRVDRVALVIDTSTYPVTLHTAVIEVLVSTFPF